MGTPTEALGSSDPGHAWHNVSESYDIIKQRMHPAIVKDRSAVFEAVCACRSFGRISSRYPLVFLQLPSHSPEKQLPFSSFVI